MIKNIKKIIMALIISLLVLISAVIFIFTKNIQKINSESKLSYINNDEWNNEIYPDGMPKLFRNYKGSLSAQNIGKSMYYFTTQVIPEYYSNLKNATESEILNYYNENAKIIAIDVGIDNDQDFKNLIESIQSLTSDNLTLDSFRIDKDDIKTFSKYTNTTLYITYLNNKEIGFNVKIYNKIKEDSSTLTYTALEDKNNNY